MGGISFTVHQSKRAECRLHGTFGAKNSSWHVCSVHNQEQELDYTSYPIPYHGTNGAFTYIHEWLMCYGFPVGKYTSHSYGCYRYYKIGPRFPSLNSWTYGAPKSGLKMGILGLIMFPISGVKTLLYNW